MDNNRATLVVYCEDRSLRTLLRGAAADSRLEFRPVSRLEEARHLLAVSSPAILVMEVKTICGEHLVLIKEAQAGFKVLVIVVLERLNDGGAAEAICAGAIACLDFQNAMRSLAFLVENVAASMLSSDHLNTKRVLLVSDQVTLTTPDYYLMDGQHDIWLAPIPGALLECLASRPNELVLSTDLIRSAWGRAEDATTNALHQHIYRLRERLSEFGIAKNLESVRGRGYILRNSSGR